MALALFLSPWVVGVSVPFIGRGLGFEGRGMEGAYEGGEVLVGFGRVVFVVNGEELWHEWGKSFTGVGLVVEFGP